MVTRCRALSLLSLQAKVLLTYGGASTTSSSGERPALHVNSVWPTPLLRVVGPMLQHICTPITRLGCEDPSLASVVTLCGKPGARTEV